MNNFKYLSVISMISISLLILAMLFTYRLIKIGPFLVPGGIIVFTITYVLADIVTEVYGYNSVKQLILGNFVCILLFNITAKFLLFFPAYSLNADSAYLTIFHHSTSIILGYSLGFALGDLLNAFFISRLQDYLHGRFFAIRSIMASGLGQFVFSIVVSCIIYSSELHANELTRQFLSTAFVKIFIIFLLAYPASLIVFLLKRVEKVSNVHDFNPFLVYKNNG